MGTLKRIKAGEYRTPEGLRVAYESEGGFDGKGTWFLYNEQGRPCDAFGTLAEARAICCRRAAEPKGKPLIEVLAD